MSFAKVGNSYCDTLDLDSDRFLTDMANYIKQTSYLAQALFIFLFGSLGILNTVAKAEHGENTWLKAGETVVVVNPTWPGYSAPGFGAPPGTAPAGAGFYYSVDNTERSPFIITAAHVVMKAKSIEIINFSGKRAGAKLHALDERRDIAVLRTDLYGSTIKVNAGKPSIGSHVCALGNSFGLGISMSCGIVSALNRHNLGINF